MWKSASRAPSLRVLPWHSLLPTAVTDVRFLELWKASLFAVLQEPRCNLRLMFLFVWHNAYSQSVESAGRPCKITITILLLGKCRTENV
jgi:hypothetical protein